MVLKGKRTDALGWDVFNGTEKVGRIFGIETGGRFGGRFGIEINGKTYWNFGLYSPKDAINRILSILSRKGV